MQWHTLLHQDALLALRFVGFCSCMEDLTAQYYPKLVCVMQGHCKQLGFTH